MAVMESEKVHDTRSSHSSGVNVSPHSRLATTVSSDLTHDNGQHSKTSALPITNTAVTPNPCFLALPLEIREQIYSYLIDHYPEHHGSGMKSNPAGNIIFRRNSFRYAILIINCQIKEEALHVFYRETVWYTRIPAASILPRSPYWAFGSWKLLQRYPFFKRMRHIKLELMMPYMHRDIYMANNRTFAFYGRVRGFEYSTDVLPRRLAVEQIVNALVHAPALKSVSIEWKDIAGWGDWEEKRLCLQPLEKLSVYCVVESVDIAFPPTTEHDLYRSLILEQAHRTHRNGSIGPYGLCASGLEKLGNYLTEIRSK